MKTVLITGASRGIGAECAALFAERGWQVLANYKSSDAEAKALAARTGCRLYRADVSKREEVAAMRAAAEADGYEVDVLINNAGVALFGLFQDVRPDKAEEMYGVNLFGTLNCTRAFLPGMIKRKRGCIINVSSVWGEVGASCEADYSAAKAAVATLTKALAKEVGFSGVRVNCLSPGVIDTDMNAALSVEEVEEIVDGVPLERLGRPRDVAEAAWFLASDAADYITGAVLPVDGGWKG